MTIILNTQYPLHLKKLSLLTNNNQKVDKAYKAIKDLSGYNVTTKQH